MLYVPRLPNVIAQAQIPKVPSDKSPAVGSMYHYMANTLQKKDSERCMFIVAKRLT